MENTIFMSVTQRYVLKKLLLDKITKQELLWLNLVTRFQSAITAKKEVLFLYFPFSERSVVSSSFSLID